MGPAVLIPVLATIASSYFSLTPHSFSPEQEIKNPVVSLSAEAKAQLSPAPTPQNITYTTKPGDTLATIARSQYGSQKYWVHIWNDNAELEDPAVIHAGTELTIRTDPQGDVEELSRELPEISTPTPTSSPEPAKAVAAANSTPAPVQRAIGAPGSFSQTYIDAGNMFGIPWQILHAIHMVETGQRDGPIGGGGGPQGPMQFMPGTWAAYGTDGNGDGVADINNAVDAIYSAANYLAKHGSIDSGLDSYGRIKEDVYNIARTLGYNP